VRRLRLTATFAVVSLVAMTGLGGALVWTTSHLLQQQALTQAARTAEAYVSSAVEEYVPEDSFRTGTLHTDVVQRLDHVFMPEPDSTLVGVRLWTGDGVVLYDSTDHSAGHRAAGGSSPRNSGSTGAAAATTSPDTPAPNAIPDPQRFQDAIQRVHAGSSAAVVSEVDASGTSVQRIDVYVPVMYDRTSPSAVAEIELSYDETAAAIHREVLTILYVTAGGLALVWLLLFRTVHRASDRAAAVSGRSGLSLALLLLDVDRFKDVNDTLGHPRGDALLVEVASRLRRTIRDADTVARLGGDEFAILLPVVDSVAAAESFAQRVRQVFEEPFDLEGMLLHVDSSVGLAVLPEHADDVTSLMARADIAMYTAKASGVGVAVYAGQDAATDASSRLMLLGDLRKALDNADELHLHYQPKIDLRTGAVVGLEALLRWEHPILGNIPPADFIPVAERTGLMQQVTARVLTLVIAQMARWREQGQELSVAVNLSARNLLEPHLDAFVADLLARYGVPATLLELEVTESAIIEDPARAIGMLRRLHDLGITVAVDDFGIGNTSMSQLGTMPLRTIKIDRSFVTHLADDDPALVLVKAIVDLAHEFGLTAVAEGVETPDVIERLRRLGCDVAQGYHWSRPVPPDELLDVVDRLTSESGARHR
jgi:diguanylate cyclase